MRSLYQKLEEKGYAVIDFLSQEQVQSLLSFYQKCPLPKDSVTDAPYLYRTEVSSDILYRSLVTQEIKKTFISKIESVFPDYKIVYCNFITKTPNSPFVSIHQDPSIVDEISQKSFIIWCPLIDVDEQNGCLQVVNKSHLLTSKPRPRFVFGGSPYSQDVLSLMQQDYLTSVPMQAGQALVFDGRLFHGSSPNLSVSERIAATCHIAPKNSSINFCYRDSQTSEKLEIFEVDDAFYNRYIRGQKPEGFKSLCVSDYKVDPLTPEQLVEFMKESQPQADKSTEIKERFVSIFNLLRGSDWWFYKIPPLLAIAYAEILLQVTPPLQSTITLLALLTSMFFVAAYGHVVNDIFDIEVDLQAGKQNRMASLSNLQHILLSTSLAVAGLIPWFFIGINTKSAFLLVTIYILLTIYSAPPLRLKEKDIWGVITDAAQVHAIPTLLVATVFSDLASIPKSESATLATVATAWAFLAGIRAIILHQIWDWQNDLNSGVKTLVTKIGVDSARFGISYIVFPSEILLLGLLMWVISQFAPLLLVFFIFYVLLKIINIKLTLGIFDTAPVQKAYILPHDFYEVWLPLALTTLLSIREVSFLSLLVLYIVLFYPAIIQRASEFNLLLLSGIKTITNFLQNNFKTKKDNLQELQFEGIGESFIAQPSNELECSIARAIDFLEQNQLDDGEFQTVFDRKYENPNHEKELVFDSSPFITSLLLYSLSFLKHEAKVQQITKKGLIFLLKEMELGGLWRYWSSKNKKHNLIPPDLDDICCVSYVLKMNNILTPNNIGIILENRNDRGIFYTWVLPRSIRRVVLNYITLGKAVSHFNELWGQTDKDDICNVVNANVLLYLGETQQTKTVIKYLIDVVLKEKEDVDLSFYNHKLSFYYMLSRVYFCGVHSLGVLKIPVINKVLNLQKADGSFGNELLTALAVCTLLNFNYHTPNLDKAIDFLLKTQQLNGSWQRIPMYGGQADKEFFGSAELTTGLCVEAIARYRLLEMTGNVQKSQAELQELQTKLQQTEQEFIQSQSQLSASQTQLAKLNSHLQQTQDQFEQIQAQLQQSERKLTQSQSQLYASQTELAQSQSELHTSQTELTQLKSYLQQTQGVEGLISYYRSRIASDPDDIQLYHQALIIKPDHAQIHLQLGNALVRQNRFNDAIASYQTGLQLYPNNFEIQLELAKALEKEEKWDEAIASYQRAIELNSDYSWSHKRLGDILAEKGQLNEASLCYRRALQLQPRLF